jgi:hypothetical protein
MTLLRTHRRLDLETKQENADPHFFTDVLYGDECGKMFGVLVCEDAQGAEVVLRAFSCQHSSAWHIPGWVGPIVDTAVFDPVAARASVEVHRLNDLIKHGEKGSVQRAALVAERRAISRRLVKELRGLYLLQNFRGEKRLLADAFVGKGGIPWGTGDCCAPKLLHAAAMRGLKPRAMAEFFWGRTNSSGTREEGTFYPPCEERCTPILGFMLCGVSDV